MNNIMLSTHRCYEFRCVKTQTHVILPHTHTRLLLRVIRFVHPYALMQPSQFAIFSIKHFLCSISK